MVGLRELTLQHGSVSHGRSDCDHGVRSVRTVIIDQRDLVVAHEPVGYAVR